MDPLPPTPPAAADLFGSALAAATSYAERLATDGVQRGLIGPREVSRLWERHLLNCAALAPLVPEQACLVDVGSGAGLPGLVLALVRPRARVVLLEPMARRTAFLTEIVTALGLDNVEVVRGRAEEVATRRRIGRFDIVTGRAVAPLTRLVPWCAPLIAGGGRLLAMKGSTADEELAAVRPRLASLGLGRGEVVSCPVGPGHEPARVVQLYRLR